MRFRYQTGFGNEFATEAVPGGLPMGQNAPQKHPLGLYTEQFSGRHLPRRAPPIAAPGPIAFAPRSPTGHTKRFPHGLIRSGPFTETPTSPNQLRWDPLPAQEKTDFLDGIVTLGGNGDPAMQAGVAIHLYAANTSMQDRFFSNADGEMLIVPQWVLSAFTQNSAS